MKARATRPRRHVGIHPTPCAGKTPISREGVGTPEEPAEALNSIVAVVGLSRAEQEGCDDEQSKRLPKSDHVQADDLMMCHRPWFGHRIIG